MECWQKTVSWTSYSTIGLEQLWKFMEIPHQSLFSGGVGWKNIVQFERMQLFSKLYIVVDKHLNRNEHWSQLIKASKLSEIPLT